ncbi:glycosyltransferase family 2 protein [Sphingomonas sp. So64.6b]|uniref:glycosyltransferase family 2 protein n=1 Tax=Sphingomonas sp. So64.6b TaxID=2997354 RepID=UPI0019233170|nr:glycosyltransferase family 2 protein [Sphingomonas sp. So64.6b]
MTVLLCALFIGTQILYALASMIDIYLFRLPVDRVDMTEEQDLEPGDYPRIVLFYPVLRELEGTMRTTFLSLRHLRYPAGLFRVMSIPNSNDLETIASLRRLQQEFDFLEIMEIPATSDPSWSTVWDAWSENPKCYWWHQGSRAENRDLPPKKTRQLIYAFYTLAARERGGSDFLVNYIDADSCPPPDHLIAAAIGIRRFDVLQASNIAGNLNDTLAASWHAFDHMAWDGRKYKHLTAGGRQPFWVLGKGLFFKASDLLALGGFHPWITIEDPEVGLRFWANGKRLGYIDNPLIEEVPTTFGHGITQRKRWVAGFFQSLDVPLKALGYSWQSRVKAWMILIPCLSYWINPIGLPVGAWAMWRLVSGSGPLPTWTIILSAANVTIWVLSLCLLYRSIWQRTALVLERRRDRLRYLLRCNPVALMIWGLVWIVPLWIGWRMYRRDGGLIWERTEKVDANASLVRRITHEI